MYQYNLGIRFQDVAEAHPSRTALWFDARRSLRYDQLNLLSNQVAHWLLAQGVGRQDLVGLSGTKDELAYAIIIACLKIGAVYCVLDPESPAERLRKILNTCNPKWVFAELALIQKLKAREKDVPLILVDRNAKPFLDAVGRCDASNLSETKRVTGDDPAYVMFTSGSTGIPKGAVITHANVLNLIDWSKATFSIAPDDVLTNVNPLYFDNSVFDIYSSLFTSASLVPFTKEEVTDPKLLVEKVDAARCTLWFSVPSLLIYLQTMKATDGIHLRSLRRIIFGGEKYPKTKLKKLYDVYSDSARFFNVYGPTECTCICSSYEIGENDFTDLHGIPPLGHIAPNFSFLILDEEKRMVRDGEVGELFLLGPNIGKGYYNDHAQTSASFVPNPFNARYREVMYKTGDLVRLDPKDGKLHVLGRKDNQIKHMGYRIELEEIDAALHQLEYVSEAVALHSVVNGISRIIAVVALRRQIEDEEISRELRQIIPDYMVPTEFHREEVLLKNANGKVDRLRLAEKYAS